MRNCTSVSEGSSTLPGWGILCICLVIRSSCLPRARECWCYCTEALHLIAPTFFSRLSRHDLPGKSKIHSPSLASFHATEGGLLHVTSRREKCICSARNLKSMAYSCSRFGATGCCSSCIVQWTSLPSPTTTTKRVSRLRRFSTPTGPLSSVQGKSCCLLRSTEAEAEARRHEGIKQR